MFIAEIYISSRYPKAIEIYEDIARQSLNNNLLKYGVKGHLLNAGICHLCKGDVVAITNALEKYEVTFLLNGWILDFMLDADILLCMFFHLQDLDPTFRGTREYRLLSVCYFLFTHSSSFL